MFKKLWISVIAGLLILTCQNVYSEKKYSIKEMTPEVQTALENRRDRYEKLAELKAKGIIGENNQGYVIVLVENKEAQDIADAENKDRKIIYNTIAQQNGLMDALQTIEKVFAQEQAERANPGEKIQKEDGSWIAK